MTGCTPAMEDRRWECAFFEKKLFIRSFLRAIGYRNCFCFYVSESTEFREGTVTLFNVATDYLRYQERHRALVKDASLTFFDMRVSSPVKLVSKKDWEDWLYGIRVGTETEIWECINPEKAEDEVPELVVANPNKRSDPAAISPEKSVVDWNETEVHIR